MRNQGTRILDRAGETRRMQWLMVFAHECRDRAAEERLIGSHFLRPHTRWSWPPAFVDPVVVQRTRRRVFMSQISGVEP